ncbi:probable indole-3-pyruvate monooxygenase YUCCA10 [Macadamia integrifolia]|uniref:probable indole-3-pyruvate monooxygenase YUCCA10 n=1 Tax=Macadamia integrifolia TaxID=60698 RepID=UPI001C4F2684|nr:probable indole-3-pyruvate monooxygenase YUCCA10 [Macadamia integrifolia]
MEGLREVEEMVVIVGAGPSGLAVSACLNVLSIPNIVLEREDCCASLWKKHSYDRLKLHLAKEFCQLPHMPFPSKAPTYVSKKGFINYLDNYVSHFNINPMYCRSVESATYDGVTGKWRVTAKNSVSGEFEVYVGKFLVVATGENSGGFIPNVNGLESFGGDILHSSEYRNGKNYCDKEVLVVGSGNSGMEIAYDLSNWGAKTSIVVRSPVHVFTKEMVRVGMVLLKSRIPLSIVDSIMVTLSKLKYGKSSKNPIKRPKQGPFYRKATIGRTPTIDVGAMKRIKKGEIKVFPAISTIKGNEVTFVNDDSQEFDAIVFATGYRSTTRDWLKGGDDLFNEHGMPKLSFPNHWKGQCGLYNVGFARKGLDGISTDAKNIAKNINMVLRY